MNGRMAYHVRHFYNATRGKFKFFLECVTESHPSKEGILLTATAQNSGDKISNPVHYYELRLLLCH